MIKLSEIRDALYDVSMETSCYYNTKTNKILWHWDFNREESTYNDEDEFNDDIISMFNFYTKNDYDIMQDFITNISNDSLRNELFNATRGKGAFHRFREITDYHNKLHSFLPRLRLAFKAHIAMKTCNKFIFLYNNNLEGVCTTKHVVVSCRLPVTLRIKPA